MADNTRVNELQDKLLKAMDILNAQALNSISFDKTITCTIETDKDKKEGKYEVNDGNTIFTAYSNDTKLRSGDTVFVTIPEGDFDNQKIIIGKKTKENDKPFIFQMPFDTFFDMTDNILGKEKNFSGELIANALNKYNKDVEYEKLLIYKYSNENETKKALISNYTRLGLRADFKSWVKEAIQGDYGLLIILYTEEQDAVGKKQKEKNYSFILNSSNMYGNPYNFETNYSQEIVIPLEDVNGVINDIEIYFYQNSNFFDKFNEPILCSENGYLTNITTNEYQLDDDGNYQLKENDALLPPNLFVDNIYLSFGYDISIFNKDYVEIYTQNRNSYRRSTDIKNDYQTENQKEINMRWVHLKDGTPIDMVAAAGEMPSETESNYEVRWYRYTIGAAAADPYSGIYWKRLFVEKQDNKYILREQIESDGKDNFGEKYIFKNLVFNPDVNKQQEKIKAIIIYNDSNGNIPYYSNELIFENEEILPPSKEVQYIMNALVITTTDETNGNYMIYGQNNDIKDTEYGKVTRMLEAWFDVNNDGKISEDNEKINAEGIKNLIWTFPDTNSMIQLLNGDDTGQKDENNQSILSKRTVTGKLPQYKIETYYSPNKSNNTIQCQYTLNGVVYTTEKEFTFGPSGTMGTDQTIVIDFIGDKNSVIATEKVAEFEIQLYDNQNKQQQIPDGIVTWAWYYNSDLANDRNEKEDLLGFPRIIQENGNSILEINDKLSIKGLYILQASVGDLITYFPIPVSNGEYSYITGATQVIYQSDGEPSYSKEIYGLYDASGDIKKEGINWKILSSTVSGSNEKMQRYIGSLRNYNSGQILDPLSIYVKDAPVYGVQALNGDTVLWTQPILVLQNKWSSNVINKWDGKSLQLDEENSAVIAAAISAGKKNSEDNTFSGVMIGDWSNEKLDTNEVIARQTGVYGFHHGAMSYAFKEDGTAFIGKSSMARINFDGENATIYSSGYYEQNNAGMIIDLYGQGTNPYIELKSSDGNSRMKLDTANDGSTIQMKRSNGSITITNTDAIYPLKIGNNFSVKWDGNINAQGGTIGDWHIIDKKLQSINGNIVLSTQSGGSIKIGSHITLNASGNGTIYIGGEYDENNRISISGAGYGTITMGTNGVITGGIIKAGTLQSNGGDNGRITLDGYLKLQNGGYIGEMESGLPGYQKDAKGVGMAAEYTVNRDGEILTTGGVVLATTNNAGLRYQNTGTKYITISSDDLSIGHDTKIEINGNSTTKLQVNNILAKNQTGIYARFA